VDVHLLAPDQHRQWNEVVRLLLRDERRRRPYTFPL